MEGAKIMEQKITLIDACIDFLNAGNYEKAIEVGKLAVEKYPDNLVAYLCLGEAYYRTLKFDAAYENFKKAESLTNKKENLMQIYSRIGKILDLMNRIDDALIYYNKSLSLAKDLGNTDIQASVLNDIASILLHKGELDKALSYYNEYLNLTKDKEDEDKAIVYSEISIIYYAKGEYQKAIQYIQKAIEIAEKYKNYHSVSFYKIHLGSYYRRIKDYKNAEKYLLEGLEGVKKIGDKYWEATGCRYLGWLYKDKGDRKKAEECYNHAYNLYVSIGSEKDAQDVLNEKQSLDVSNDSPNDSPLKKLEAFSIGF
jgi:tetratricopeptide (TPR) repeat protein